jgi:hypothetical protein
MTSISRDYSAISFTWATAVCIGFAFINTSANAQAAATSLTRNEDGTVRISVKVTGAGIQDVHLCVARTKDTETEQSTITGESKPFSLC